jgi:hypothetical protein
MAHTDFCTPHALTILLRTRSRPLIMLITIHDTKLSYVLFLIGATLNVMILHAFEAM